MSSFKINVPDSAIETLHKKLDAATFPDELDTSEQWQYGAPLKDVKRLAEAWKTFDWRRAETKLNEIHQFMTSIQPEGYDAINIHYVFQPSPVKNAIPLLFCHGCTDVVFLHILFILTLHRARLFPRGDKITSAFDLRG
jgi:hypothetical protein